jgi:class 3 adenylate cyclase/tetratricopeptide (TPR) repeat protein
MIACPSCARPNPTDFAFCPDCGAKLPTEPGPSATQGPLTEERKIVTMLFCDLVGFTALSEAHDHENVDALLRSYASCARGVVESHGGVVEKYIGDAVVAVFGFPRTHDDDPERAVRAALKIAREVPKIEWPGDAPLVVRIGVNTGETYLHTDIDPSVGETFLTGDAVNTAARLQSAAPPGGVVVGELTHGLIERTFVCEGMEPLALKGKADPVHAWLIREPVARTGLRTSGETATPFFGRQREIGALRDALGTASQNNRAQFRLLIGEPGLGKSRVVLEFAKCLDAVPELITWRQGRCLAYGEGVTFWPLGEIFKAHAGILDSDDAATVEAKLEVVLPESEDRPWLRQRLRPLLGLSASEASREESFAAWTQLLRHITSRGPTVLVIEDLHWAGEAMLAFVEHLLEEKLAVPLLILATSRPELLQGHHGTLTASLADGDKFARLTLAPLSGLESGALLAALLDTELPSEIDDRIVDLVGGNPLYAEQYVRLLLDRGLLVGTPEGLRLDASEELPLPDTIQAVLSARLDTLPLQQKALLCDAAVIGESFWRGGVAALSGCSPTEIDESMTALMSRDLVRPVVNPSMAGEAEYLFWHALARDVAYAQLPRRVRVEKHVATADWLEGAAGERADEFADVLAHHYVTALDLATVLRDRESAASLRLPTGRRLVRAGEHNRSIDSRTSERQLEQALELLPSESQERSRVLFLLGEAISWQRPKEAIRHFEKALAGLRQGDELNETAGCLVQLAECLMACGAGGWQILVDEAMELFDEERPTFELVVALQELSCIRLLGDGDCRGAIGLADRSLTLAERLNRPVPVGALGWRGAARCWLGDDGGLDDFRRAIEVAEAQGFGMQLLNLRHNYACSVLPRRGPAAALPLFCENAELARQRGNQLLSLGGRASAVVCHEDLGEWDRALSDADELATMAPQDDLVDVRAMVNCAQARLLVARGRPKEAAPLADWLTATARAGFVQPELVAQCCAAAAAVRSKLGRLREAHDLLTASLMVPGWRESAEPEMVRVALACGDDDLAARLSERFLPITALHRHALTSTRGLLAEVRGEREVAVAAFANAALRWSDFGMPYEQAQALLGQGRCLMALDRAPEAESVLDQAREILAQLKAQPALEETVSLLGEATVKSHRAQH